jgi:outer membrane protein assembly factor BamD (BamD/ComL family)
MNNIVRRGSYGFMGLAIILAVFLSLSWAQQPDSQNEERVNKAKEFYQQGQKLLLQGDYEGANKEFAKAEVLLQNNYSASVQQPDNSPMVSQKAVVFENNTEKNSKDPNNADASAQYDKAVEAIKKGDYQAAEAAFKKALSFDPQDKDACYNLAVLYDLYIINKEDALKYYLRYLNTGAVSDDSEKVKSWIKQINAELGKQ